MKLPSTEIEVSFFVTTHHNKKQKNTFSINDHTLLPSVNTLQFIIRKGWKAITKKGTYISNK